MLSGPGVFPLVSRLMQTVVYFSTKLLCYLCICGDLFYLGWSLVMSAMGIYGLHMCMCLDGPWRRHIRGFVFEMIVVVFGIFLGLCLGDWQGFVCVYSGGNLGSCWLLGYIFFCGCLGLLLSKALYFVMVVLPLVDVCLVMILWASILVFLPILARSSTQVCKSTGLVGEGGMLGVWINCSDIMSGSLWRWVRGYWHVALMALWMVWWIFSSCFHFLCCVLGRKPPWFLTLVGRGRVGLVIQVCSIYWLRELMISWSVICAFSHCVWVRYSYWRGNVRFSIAKFCFSLKVVCRLCRLLGGIGYIIQGRFMGLVWSLMTILFEFSWSWTG